MNILIADKISEAAVSELRKLNKVTFNPDLKAEDLPSHVADQDILIVRSTNVTEETISGGKKLSLIIRAGAGFNTIDVEAASSKGIPVANCPGRNKAAVAELTIGMMAALDRRIIDATLDLRNGKWKKIEYSVAKGLKSRTLGLIGTGNVAIAIADRAKAMKMNVIAFSPNFTAKKAEKLGIEFCPNLEVMAEKADVISVNVAYSEQTHHLIDEKFLSKVKDGLILINTSRGEVVETVALTKAVKDKKLRVGLDVFENEPGSGEAPFDQKELAGKIICTPHIGASTAEAAEAIAAEVVRIVNSYIETGKPINCVNIRSHSKGNKLIVRHLNKVGVLAGVLHTLRDEGINIEEMENTIFRGGKAASCALLIDKPIGHEALQRIENTENILSVDIKN